MLKYQGKYHGILSQNRLTHHLKGLSLSYVTGPTELELWPLKMLYLTTYVGPFIKKDSYTFDKSSYTVETGL